MIKMGYKKNDGHRKEQIHLYLTKAEKAAFMAYAQKHDMSISSFARMGLIHEMNRDPEILDYYNNAKMLFKDEEESTEVEYEHDEYSDYKLDSRGNVYLDNEITDDEEDD